MGVWFKGLTGIAIAAVLMVAQAEEPDALDWLERMSANVHAHNYRGTFIIQRGERIDTIRVIHAAENGGYRERLQTLTGSSREVVRSVDRLGTLKDAHADTPDDSSGGPQWPPAIAGTLLRSHDRYHLQILGYDRVAGLPCHQIRAQAQDDYRFSHQYCLYKGSGFPLSSELFNGEGVLLERVVFTEIEFLDAVGEESLQPLDYQAHRVEVRANVQPYPDDSFNSPWYFDSLPPGFVPLVLSEKDIGTSRPPALHFVLSDGLATVSVYAERLHNDETFEATSRFGATHALALPTDEFQVTAVGEVPQKTMLAIVQALRYRGSTVGLP